MVKKQKNTTHNEEKNQLIKTDLKLKQELMKMYIKIVFITVFPVYQKL